MKAKKEEKFVVFKKDDLDNYFSQFTKGVFTTDKEKKTIDKVTWNEVVEGISNNNKYIVLNQDEPYAELVWQIILLFEDVKELRKKLSRIIDLE